MSITQADFKKALVEAASALENTLDHLLPDVRGPEAQLLESMRYSAMDGGKRLRPFLVLASSALFSVDRQVALQTAAAVECVHCYSLIHDDLPAMDDDDLRRGRPSNHKQFDEATAILAGDGLLTFAFEILASERAHADPRIRIELIRSLSHAAGPQGLVGGQMIDLASEGKVLDVGTLTRLNQMKTGALISFASEAGAILGKVEDERRHALHAYAHDMGLAFQMADDLLDIQGNVDDLGKNPGKDEAAGKATFVAVLGVDRARDHAAMLCEQAVRHLECFDEKADLLRECARFVINRES
jgi:farnesyl diphosphate synthase